MQKYKITKKTTSIAEIIIEKSCLTGSPKIDALIKDITFGEIPKVGNLINTEYIESPNYRMELKIQDDLEITYIILKKEPVITIIK